MKKKWILMLALILAPFVLSACHKTENKAIGRYKLWREGDNTWLFDTATGKTCVEFAPSAFWNSPKGTTEGCAELGWIAGSAANMNSDFKPVKDGGR
ncbi:MAG: hypothetical protein M0Z75_08595 [Nitrospiraceae bacterium]|nr:hypothetical protein [Nitrospiraceae bacterium]